MEFIENIMREKAGELIGTLTDKADFSQDQAQKFLPELGSSLGPVIASRAADLDLSNLAEPSNLSTIMNALDIQALASRAGVSRETGAKGLQAILPIVMSLIADRGSDAGGLLGLIGGDAAGALDSLKGMGNFFK